MEALEAFFNPQASAASSQPAADSATGTFDVDAVKDSADTEVPTSTATATGETYDENDQEVRNKYFRVFCVCVCVF
jgi:hypothetical protein